MGSHNKQPLGLKLFFAAVILFLYLPMLILVIYSFNESRLVTVWAGFSTKWYFELFKDRAMMSAVMLSLKIAFFSASASVILGTMAAFALVRSGRFWGHKPFGIMVTAPMVMPEVIMGLSLLLLFVAIGIPRGQLTIWLAHTTFGLAYVAIMVSSRLAEMDRSLEEAAQDLGATPLKSFFLITLPIIAPALVSGWLLAFTLSLDDLVIASFVSGPGATTLPMEVFSSVRMGVSPKVNALATLLILVVSVAGIVSWLFMRRADRLRQAQIRAAMNID